MENFKPQSARAADIQVWTVHRQAQERIFLIVVALVGAVAFSYCMGTISSLISEVCRNTC